MTPNTIDAIKIQPDEAHYLKQILDIEDFDDYTGPINTSKITDRIITYFTKHYGKDFMVEIRVCAGQSNAWVEAELFNSDGVTLDTSEPTHNLLEPFILRTIDSEFHIGLTHNAYTIIDLPSLDLFRSTKEKDGILAFYEALGFDNVNHKSLEPSHIVLNTDELTRAVDIYTSTYPEEDQFAASFLFMNNGPSSDNHMEKGKLLLVDGWITK